MKNTIKNLLAHMFVIALLFLLLPTHSFANRLAVPGPVLPLSDKIILDGKWKVEDKQVSLKWSKADSRIVNNRYNVYMDGVKINKKSIKAENFLYKAKAKDLNKVHEFSIKCVNRRGKEIFTSNVKKLGFVTNKESFIPAASVKIPMSDFSGLEYVGPMISDPRYDFWCTSVIENDGKFHLFTARWDTRMTFYPAWHNICEIAYYVSDKIDGTYKEVGVIWNSANLPKGYTAPHNVQVSEFEGKFVMIFIVQEKGAAGPITGGIGIQKVMMATSDKIDGDWILQGDRGVVVEDGNKATNPAFLKYGDEYRIYYKREAYGKSSFNNVTYMLAVSDKLTGPYIKQGQVLDNPGVIEDATIFYSHDKLLMVVQDFMSHVSGAGYGVVYDSADGRSFAKNSAQVAFGTLQNHISLPKGWNYTHTTSHQMERPNIVVDEDGVPTHIIGTCRTSVDGVGNSHAYLFKLNNDVNKVKVKTVANGTLAVNVSRAGQYQDITVSVKADKGMMLIEDSLKVQYTVQTGAGTFQKEDILFLNNENTAVFPAPASDCSITARFAKGTRGSVEQISLHPAAIKMSKNESKRFSATVKGSGTFNKGIFWSLVGDISIKTKISDQGVLSIGEHERATHLSVVATSKHNGSVVGSAFVRIDAAAPKENLALGQTYTASSSFKNGKGLATKPSYAFDGNRAFGDFKIWTAKDNDRNYYLQLNFNKKTTFNQISIFDSGDFNRNSRIIKCDLELSNDGKRWKRIGSFKFDANAEEKQIILKKALKASKLRLTKFVTTNTTAHIMEVEIHKTETTSKLPAVLELIITTPATKTAYTNADIFDSTGMVVSALYDDKVIKKTNDYLIIPNRSLKTSDTEITILYGGKQVSQAITVKAAAAIKDSANFVVNESAYFAIKEPVSVAVKGAIYVSATGSDRADGSAKNPVLTLKKAQELARRKKPTAAKPAQIIVTEGKYYSARPLKLTYKDSFVNWKAKGEVVLTGAKTLKDLTWTPYKNGIIKSDVGAGMNIDQLFINGKQQIMARYPNYNPNQALQGCTSAGNIKARSASWANPAGAYLRALHNHKWGGNSFFITGKANNHLGLQTKWVGDNSRGSGIHSQSVMVENIFEEIDAPTEWFYNKKTGILYLKPANGLTLDKTSVVEVAIATEVIHIEGVEDGRLARNISFDGFILENTRRTLFDGTYVPLMRGDWGVVRSGALFLENTKNIKFENGSIRNIGGNGIFVSGHNKNVLIHNNDILNIGSSGILFAGDPDSCREPSFWSHTPKPDVKRYYTHKTSINDRVKGPAKAHFPRECTVSNNHIKNVGIWEKQSSQVAISVAYKIYILNNTINDGPRAGININDGTFGGHKIAYNDIFDVQRETDDHGMFNSWGRDRFWSLGGFDARGGNGAQKYPASKLDAVAITKIHDNRMHFGGRVDGGSTFGIDLDDGSTNYEIYNNLCLNMGIKLREGFNRNVYNNILVNGPVNLHCTFEDSNDIFERNIVIIAKPYSLAATNESRFAVSKNSIDHNWFYNFGLDISFPSFWAKQKFDNHSYKGAVSPMFANPEANDYSVKNKKAAKKIGFINFPMNQFGQPGCKEQSPIYVTQGHEGGNEDDLENEEWMGSTISKLNNSIMSSTGSGSTFGVYFEEVPKNSKAAKYGFEPYDVLHVINGTKIIEKSTFIPIFSKLKKGEEIRIRVMRNQYPVDIKFHK